jgi:hypothetical protein
MMPLMNSWPLGGEQEVAPRAPIVLRAFGIDRGEALFAGAGGFVCGKQAFALGDHRLRGLGKQFRVHADAPEIERGWIRRGTEAAILPRNQQRGIGRNMDDNRNRDAMTKINACCILASTPSQAVVPMRCGTGAVQAAFSKPLMVLAGSEHLVGSRRHQF